MANFNFSKSTARERTQRLLKEYREENGIEVKEYKPKKTRNRERHSVDKFLEKGIYYLYKDNEIVYVGMSDTNCMQRICTHWKEAVKDFDSFKINLYPKYSRRQLLREEAYYIRKIKPKYNETHVKRKK